MRLVLVDGYVDEPSVFGVPPYVSPYVRYAAGAAIAEGAEVVYRTVDQLRARPEELEGDLLAVLASCSVPGKYLRGAPITHNETLALMRGFRGATLLFGDNAAFGFPDRGGGSATTRTTDAGGFLRDHIDHLSTRDGDAAIRDFFAGREVRNRFRSPDEWATHARLGAPVVAQHPDNRLGVLMAEMETFHGCVHYVSGGCHFCSDAKKAPTYREEEDIIDEVRLLREAGVRHFRLGGQTCFWTYKAIGVGETDEPRPNVEATQRLLEGVHEVAPDRKVLHIDNANPAVLAMWPDEAAAIADLLVQHGTDGNIAAFGLESADPVVHEANNLNCTAEQVLEATRILNRASGHRGPGGLPFLLPGINLLYGLPGESRETYAHNWRFLQRLKQEDLRVRRIQVRQLLPIRGQKQTVDPRRKALFVRQKRQIRDEIDHPMLQQIVPVGTVLRDVYLEKQEPGLTLGRQVATYALLVGIPYETPLDRFVDVLVTDHGMRSVTGVPVPFHVPSASLKQLQALPGIGKKRALALKARPPEDLEALAAAIGDDRVTDLLAPHLAFGPSDPAHLLA